mmetsp:Transcript_11823/g.35014  ORF Transcript_11823/g.35014 Transcript_11823/m.35014 type:complete len:200 (+) Transcript_11823:306-905(+)
MCSAARGRTWTTRPSISMTCTSSILRANPRPGPALPPCSPATPPSSARATRPWQSASRWSSSGARGWTWRTTRATSMTCTSTIRTRTAGARPWSRVQPLCSARVTQPVQSGGLCSSLVARAWTTWRRPSISATCTCWTPTPGSGPRPSSPRTCCPRSGATTRPASSTARCTSSEGSITTRWRTCTSSATTSSAALTWIP